MKQVEKRRVGGQFMDRFSISERALIFISVISVGISAIFFINHILVYFDWKQMRYIEIPQFDAMPVLGNDFRMGEYRLAKSLLETGAVDRGYIPYPPFSTALFMPYLLFTEDQATQIHIYVSFFFTLINIGLFTSLISDFIFAEFMDNPVQRNFLALAFGGLFTFYCLTSYPFAFSIERGQNDYLSEFFILQFFRLLLKKPEKLWAQIIFLSFSVHLKIYPVFLFLPLLLKHGKKVIPPTILVNIALLFSCGYPTLKSFFDALFISIAKLDLSWAGDHSVFSFAKSLMGTEMQFQIIRASLYAIIAIIFGIATVIVFREGYTNRKALEFLMLSLPLMLVLPPSSMDYRIVILIVGMAIQMAFLLWRFCVKPSAFVAMLTGALLIVMLNLSRTYNAPDLFIPDTDSYFFRNKFLGIMAFLLLAAINVIANRAELGEKPSPNEKAFAPAKGNGQRAGRKKKSLHKSF